SVAGRAGERHVDPVGGPDELLEALVEGAPLALVARGVEIVGDLVLAADGGDERFEMRVRVVDGFVGEDDRRRLALAERGGHALEVAANFFAPAVEATQVAGE